MEQQNIVKGAAQSELYNIQLKNSIFIKDPSAMLEFHGEHLMAQVVAT